MAVGGDRRVVAQQANPSIAPASPAPTGTSASTPTVTCNARIEERDRRAIAPIWAPADAGSIRPVSSR